MFFVSNSKPNMKTLIAARGGPTVDGEMPSEPSLFKHGERVVLAYGAGSRVLTCVCCFAGLKKLTLARVLGHLKGHGILEEELDKGELQLFVDKVAGAMAAGQFEQLPMTWPGLEDNLDPAKRQIGLARWCLSCFKTSSVDRRACKCKANLVKVQAVTCVQGQGKMQPFLLGWGQTSAGENAARIAVAAVLAGSRLNLQQPAPSTQVPDLASAEVTQTTPNLLSSATVLAPVFQQLEEIAGTTGNAGVSYLQDELLGQHILGQIVETNSKMQALEVEQANVAARKAVLQQELREVFRRQPLLRTIWRGQEGLPDDHKAKVEVMKKKLNSPTPVYLAQPHTLRAKCLSLLGLQHLTEEDIQKLGVLGTSPRQDPLAKAVLDLLPNYMQSLNQGLHTNLLPQKQELYQVGWGGNDERTSGYVDSVAPSTLAKYGGVLKRMVVAAYKTPALGFASGAQSIWLQMSSRTLEIQEGRAQLGLLVQEMLYSVFVNPANGKEHGLDLAKTIWVSRANSKFANEHEESGSDSDSDDDAEVESGAELADRFVVSEVGYLSTSSAGLRFVLNGVLNAQFDFTYGLDKIMFFRAHHNSLLMRSVGGWLGALKAESGSLQSSKQAIIVSKDDNGQIVYSTVQGSLTLASLRQTHANLSAEFARVIKGVMGATTERRGALSKLDQLLAGEVVEKDWVIRYEGQKSKFAGDGFTGLYDMFCDLTRYDSGSVCSMHQTLKQLCCLLLTSTSSGALRPEDQHSLYWDMERRLEGNFQLCLNSFAGVSGVKLRGRCSKQKGKVDFSQLLSPMTAKLCFLAFGLIPLVAELKFVPMWTKNAAEEDKQKYSSQLYKLAYYPCAKFELNKALLDSRGQLPPYNTLDECKRQGLLLRVSTGAFKAGMQQHLDAVFVGQITLSLYRKLFANVNSDCVVMLDREKDRLEQGLRCFAANTLSIARASYKEGILRGVGSGAGHSSLTYEQHYQAKTSCNAHTSEDELKRMQVVTRSKMILFGHLGPTLGEEVGGEGWNGAQAKENGREATLQGEEESQGAVVSVWEEHKEQSQEEEYVYDEVQQVAGNQQAGQWQQAGYSALHTLKSSDFRFPLQQGREGQVHSEADMSPALSELYRCCVRGDHAFVCLPCGQGKTWMQILLAGNYTRGFTVIVVPIVGLVQSVQIQCERMGVGCMAYSNEYGQEYAHDLHETSLIRVVVVVVETATTPQFGELLHAAQTLGLLQRVVIDECHEEFQSRLFRPKFASLSKVNWGDGPKTFMSATMSEAMFDGLGQVWGLDSGNRGVTRVHVPPQFDRFERMIVRGVGWGEFTKQIPLFVKQALFDAREVKQARVSIKALVFCDTKDRVESFRKWADAPQGLEAYFVTAETSKVEMEDVVNLLLDPGKTQLIVYATTCLSVGIDVSEATHVVVLNSYSAIHVTQSFGRLRGFRVSGSDKRGTVALLQVVSANVAGVHEEDGKLLRELKQVGLGEERVLGRWLGRRSVVDWVGSTKCYATSLSQLWGSTADRDCGSCTNCTTRRSNSRPSFLATRVSREEEEFNLTAAAVARFAQYGARCFACKQSISFNGQCTYRDCQPIKVIGATLHSKCFAVYQDQSHDKNTCRGPGILQGGGCTHCGRETCQQSDDAQCQTYRSFGNLIIHVYSNCREEFLTAFPELRGKTLPKIYEWSCSKSYQVGNKRTYQFHRVVQFYRAKGGLE